MEFVERHPQNPYAAPLVEHLEPLLNLREAVMVQDICAGYLPEGYYRLLDDGLSELETGIEEMFDVPSLHGFLCYLAFLVFDHKRVSAVNCEFFAPGANGEFRVSENAALVGAYGERLNWDVLLVPVYFPGHFGIVICERDAETKFFDPLPHGGRLTERYVDRIRSAIRQFGGPADGSTVIVTADDRTYNCKRTV